MSRRMSVFIVVIMAAIVLSTAVVIIYDTDYLHNNDKIELLLPSDIHIPQNIIENEFGLFFYDDIGNKIRTTENDVPFDPNKPVIILFYGMNNELGIESEGFDNYKGWLNADYNVGCFIWNQLSDDQPMRVEKKIWGKNPADLRFNYTNTVDMVEIEEEDTFEYSIAQIFVAYYYDFMQKSAFSGREIRFEGMSLGAQLLTASCSYLMALQQSGTINRDYLPDRVTLFDAYFTNMQNNAYVDWLQKEIGYDGSVALSLDIVKMLRKNGIAVEFIRSSSVEDTTIIGDGAKDNFEKLKNETCFIDYRSDWIASEKLSQKRVVGKEWYNTMIGYGLPDDYNISATAQYGVSPTVPTSYAFARMGAYYDMQTNYTLDPMDDIQFSTNVRVPFVAGFAFLDQNKDGNNNERLAGRMKGVKVELYLKENGVNKLIGVTRTKESGYYELPIEPIYITNTDGREFFVKVKLPMGYKISSSLGNNDKYYMMTNNIKQDNESNSFFIYSKKELKIINIGIIRK